MFMSIVIVLQSEASHTVASLWDGTRVIARAVRPVGVRQTSVDGHNGQVRTACQETIAEVMQASGLAPEAIVCSGMITANVGLHEVPHIPAPAGVAELATGLVRKEFPELAPVPFYFVPGVKSVPAELTAETLGETDIARGEEAETIGLLELTGLAGPALLMRYQFTHKAIAVDGTGRIAYTRTALTGEIIPAVAEYTLAKASLAPLDQVEPVEAMWRAGLAQAQSGGFGRALFLTRVAEQIWKRSKAEATSFFMGVALSLDLPLLAGARESGATVVAYGKGHFPGLLKAYLEGEGWPGVRTLDEATAELAPVLGAVRVWERAVGRA